ncbi:hypothetical protein BLD49_15395 [Erwinia sp. OLMDSP33]|nr:hypothetical protein BLD49_15395 [Erwinia sp. OLMDSP33]
MRLNVGYPAFLWITQGKILFIVGDYPQQPGHAANICGRQQIKKCYFSCYYLFLFFHWPDAN